MFTIKTQTFERNLYLTEIDSVETKYGVTGVW